MKECILSNSSVRIEINESDPETKGSASEVGLIQFYLDNDDLNIKRNIMVRKMKDKPEQLKLYFKGSPEAIIPICGQTLDDEGKPKKLTSDD